MAVFGTVRGVGGGDVLTRALPAWLEPIKKKLIAARKAGATLEQLREQMLEWHPNTQALAGAFAENVEAGLRAEGADETVTAQCNQYKHDEGCDKDSVSIVEESTTKDILPFPELPSSMEEVKTVPELAKYGVPHGRVFVRKKLKGKFPIKGRMKNKKKAIRRFLGVLTPPFHVSKPYDKTDNKGQTHKRIDIVKDINGKTAQLVIQTSGDYAGGIVTYIDDISKARKQRKTKDARSIG